MLVTDNSNIISFGIWYFSMTPSISNPLVILIQWSTVKLTIGKIQQAEPIRCLYKQISNVCVNHPTQINLHIETQTLL